MADRGDERPPLQSLGQRTGQREVAVGELATDAEDIPSRKPGLEGGRRGALCPD